jgi:hypothetical protein
MLLDGRKNAQKKNILLLYPKTKFESKSEAALDFSLDDI